MECHGQGADEPLATRRLRRDLAALEALLAGVTVLARRIRDGAPVHPLLLAGAIGCLQASGRCHDRQVQGVLLPAVEALDAAAAAEAATWTAEAYREAGRRLAELRRILEGSRWPNDAVSAAADDVVATLRAHAAQEITELLPLADRLPDEDAARVDEDLRRVEEHEIPPPERAVLDALAASVDPRRLVVGNGHAHVDGIVAAHVMRPRPRSLRPTDSLARAAELMDRTGVRELPIVDGVSLVGILSRSDLVPHVGHLEWTRADAAMTPDPVVVGPEQPAVAVSQVLLRERVNAVPVVAQEQTLIGMVSRADILRALTAHAS